MIPYPISSVSRHHPQKTRSENLRSLRGWEKTIGENSAHSAVIACVSGDEGWRIPEFMLCERAERALKIAILGVLEPEIADLEGARCVKIAVLGYLKWFFVFLTLF